MSKPLVVIADRDATYLATYEEKFLRELDNKIELEIITDELYFDEFFATPKTVEILVVGECFYTQELQRHNINNLFLLTEENETGATEDLTVTKIFKYSGKGIREIYNELTYRSRDKLYQGDDVRKDTMVIGFYSAIGGTGKTSLSIGLAEALAQNHQRVLYINSESIHSFGYYLNDMNGMSNDGYRAIRDDIKRPYNNVKPFIRKENFSYIPPFMATLDALNMNSRMFVDLVTSAKESKDYDFIIVDIESGYSLTRTELLEASDKVIMVMIQDQMSLYKTEYILRNIDFRDREKYLFICNKYKENKENAYFESPLQKRFPLHEYVHYVEEPMTTAKELGELSEIQRIATLFI